jgi:hypothetical protein
LALNLNSTSYAKLTCDDEAVPPGRHIGAHAEYGLAEDVAASKPGPKKASHHIRCTCTFSPLLWV